MKLIRYGEAGKEKPGIVDTKGAYRDLSKHINDVAGATLGADSLSALQQLDIDSLPEIPADVRLGPCVGNVGKFICIGLNYEDHARETSADIPQEPIIFMKATSAISGPNDPIIRPKNSTKLDWEVELAIVIGESISYADEAQAEKAIAGYCICNDISEREFQLERGGQWDKGKGCDSFGPLGPWLVTKEEIKDVLNLDMTLQVNGKQYQNGSTRTMIFPPAYVVSYISQFMSLQPGDVISTGTPPGVGLGMKPPVWLQPGDNVELQITGLGQQRQVVKDYQETL
ncbi:fumarylacetoacetate hydrolase family protein [Alteromonas pelagimontana]|uniref:Fumarylacetoacetate hydrolase family protein n=1 Tax=Alteromonas pelagimontana TaxID=1858656 RepID=A0A6M4MGT6_9ALTE|nr:fumarylacetoacetate hydrolase family protein [Alteromonas pelagimontana]QJR82272.1 fumarylacetoacetate hydrolase family protein [Alteromonas pelagimontana]